MAFLTLALEWEPFTEGSEGQWALLETQNPRVDNRPAQQTRLHRIQKEDQELIVIRTSWVRYTPTNLKMKDLSK